MCIQLEYAPQAIVGPETKANSVPQIKVKSIVTNRGPKACKDCRLVGIVDSDMYIEGHVKAVKRALTCMRSDREAC